MRLRYLALIKSNEIKKSEKKYQKIYNRLDSEQHFSKITCFKDKISREIQLY